MAPQARDSPWESGTDNLVDLWDSSSAPPTIPSQSSNLVDLMGDADVLHDDIQPSPAAAAVRPQPLLSFDEMMDGTFCAGPGAEDNPSSLVDVTGPDQMTLSYQHALQHASGVDDGQLLMTNGETLLKEGTQVRRSTRFKEKFYESLFVIVPFLLLHVQASEGYFSQSQEEDFGQSEESSAKPAAVFYNKPPGESNRTQKTGLK